MKSQMKWQIPISKVPKNVHIHDYILAQTDLQVQIRRFSQRKRPLYLEHDLRLGSRALKRSVLEGLKLYGTRVFKRAGLKSYHSAELTETDVFFPRKSSSFDNTFTQIQKTQISQHQHIQKLIDSFDRTILKSRIAVIKAQQKETQDLNYMWHQDESIFLNLRVNIPVVTSKNYAIQILNAHNNKAPIQEFAMKTGKAYVYNTGLPHRAYCKKMNPTDRIHLIIGCSPWFDFDFESKTWLSNEFYGEIHPFDMFQKGLVSTLISKTRLN